MNKLILSGVGALALVAMSATSVGAWGMFPFSSSTTNSAFVSNSVNVDANTGDNSQTNIGRTSGGLFSMGSTTTNANNSMLTGGAVAEALVQTEANNGCGCETGLFGGTTRNRAMVMNDIDVDADTGDNYQKNYGSTRGGMLGLGDLTTNGNNSMTTGGAMAGASVWTVVNSSFSLE